MTDTNHHVLTGKVDITSNLLVGSSHLFVDTNNNRVGLVTANPDAGLHVNSNAYVNTDLRVGSQIEINATAGRVKAASFEGDGSLLENIPAGADGAAATIGTPTITTGLAGTEASVTNSGTSSAAVFDFVIPRGDAGTNGTNGTNGANGEDGEDGAAATIAVGTTTPGPVGTTTASVINSGTSSAAVFDFVIPRGEQGTPGTNGTNYFELSGSDIYRNTGNVGIGTTSPGYQLDLQNISKAMMRIKSNATSGDGDAILYIDSSQTGESDIDFMHDGVLNWRLRTGDASGTNFQIHNQNDASAFAIKQDGNVGIGESSPAELVHIRGNGPHMLIEGASNENGQIDFSSGPSYRNRRHQIESRHYALSGNGYRNWLAFRVNEGGQSTPTTRMVIRGDGRVCIGQDHTTALALLDIKDGRTATSPNHNMAFYVTTGINATGPGPEIRHTNQSQGIGFGYQSIYATGYNSNQPINIISRGTDNVLIKNYSAYSDDRIKTNEEYITNATETLMKLKPQIYDKHEKINEICDDPTREAGLIAQDVYYDAPELRYLVSARNDGIDDEPAVNIPEEKPFVDDDPTKDPDYSGWGNASAGIAYIQLVPYLIKAVQEIHQTHQTTKEELQSEKNKVATMELLVASLLKRVGDLENLVI